MADQSLRLSYTPSKGGMLRLLFKPTALANSGTLIVLPNAMCTVEFDPRNEEMTEGDSYGAYLPPTLQMNMIRVDLRRRQGNVSLDALGVRALSFVDAVFVDLGPSGYGDEFWHMSVGPYNRGAPQMQNISEGFSLMGGLLVNKGIAVPTHFQNATAQPALGGYIKTNVSMPSGL